jgi:hypothetical protein
MIVRYVKTLKPEDISRITEARTKTEAFSTVLNLNFLYEALNLPTRIPIKVENSIFSPYDRTLLNVPLGKLPSPNYWFVQTFKEMGYKVLEKVGFSDYKHNMTLHLALINLGKENSAKAFAKADVLLTLGEKNHYSPLEFKLGFLSDPLQNKESSLAFSNYFYNRKELYFKTFEVLLKNKARLEKATTKPFARALLGLFSIKDFELEVPAFYIPSATKTKLAVPGAEAFFEPAGSRRKLIGFYNPGRGFIEHVKLLLLDNNELAIDFYTFDEMATEKGESLTQATLNNIKEKPLFEAFISENLAPWLENIMLLTAFEEKLFNKLRTKILLENL